MYIKLISLLCIISFSSVAQNVIIKGLVVDTNGEKIPNVYIFLNDSALNKFTNTSGYFEISLQASYKKEILHFKHSSYKTSSQEIILSAGNQYNLTIQLQNQLNTLDSLVVLKNNISHDEVSTFNINPKSAQSIPNPFYEFNTILSTLPGVTVNNEFSSAYKVRGGNFDENLVYVNSIPIYRPFLVRTGEQEGLSFINPDLVENISFSAGGWQPKYGDKLSSVLDITYKKPKKSRASAQASLLGFSVHGETSFAKNRVHLLLGVRQKLGRYLLNTLDVKGAYFPRFFDAQTFISIDLSKQKYFKKPRTSLDILFAYARNRYLITPQSRETTFGTIDQLFKLYVAFVGKELMEYDTYQTGINLSHYISKKLKLNWTISGITTQEKEFSELESGYRLCDVNNIPGTTDFNECITTLGIGTEFYHARNILTAKIGNTEVKTTFAPSSKHILEAGIALTYEDITDKLDEYSFTDSADFVSINNSIFNKIKLTSYRTKAFIQHTAYLKNHSLTYGIRLNYWSLNNQLLTSPRIQYYWQPPSKQYSLKAAIGIYQQAPFYRELRDINGKIYQNVKAQTSLHNIIGIDYNLTLWGRSFKFLAEAYYKYFFKIIPYDIDNVRIRYYPNEEAKAYAWGIDTRLSGEFIKSVESWFSLSILSTKENWLNNQREWIRRPSDQNITVSIFFQDYLPSNPSIRGSLKLLYGSPLPFGPPNDISLRNTFNGDNYVRVDVGISKVLLFSNTSKNNLLSSLWLGVEILNLFGTENTISYTWIQDVNQIQYAIPNTLSARFLNVKAIAKF